MCDNNKKFLLKPSSLGVAAIGSSQANADSSNCSTSLAAGSNNPFFRVSKDNDDATHVVESSQKCDIKDDEFVEQPDPFTMLRKNKLERTNIFAAVKANLPRVPKKWLIFGHNMHERVVGVNGGTARSDSSSTKLLYSSVLKNAAQITNNRKDASDERTLNVAREYEANLPLKRKYANINIATSEENEINIADISCKLFAFVNSNWEERGRGSLRLSDAKNQCNCSRVVLRTSGNHRLLLNTEVCAAMVAERASQKSLRLTAVDSTGAVQIFLAMGRPEDIAYVHNVLTDRIASSRLHMLKSASASNDDDDVASSGPFEKTS